jgi:hypothetical protein
MVSRRQFLTIGAGGVVAAAISSRAPAQTPKNYGPNLGFDYGGRLVAAWLDR